MVYLYSMIKRIVLPLLFLISLRAEAQKDMDALIAAENSFAAFSVAHSTKEAFLQYIDSNSLMFDKGKAVKAHEFWRTREKKPGVLNWHPVYAEISASGDFGYTTGPWTFQATATDTVAARGQYATVWYRNNDGEWKFLIDLGVDDVPADTTKAVHVFNTPKAPDNVAAIAHIFPMVAAENQYVSAFTKSKYAGCRKYISAQSILLRNGRKPAVTPDEQKKAITATPAGIKYKMEGWNISSTPDLGYTYGTVSLNGKAEGYFRVWRHEKDGWKIVLEVVRIQR